MGESFGDFLFSSGPSFATRVERIYRQTFNLPSTSFVISSLQNLKVRVFIPKESNKTPTCAIKNLQNNSESLNSPTLFTKTAEMQRN